MSSAAKFVKLPILSTFLLFQIISRLFSDDNEKYAEVGGDMTSMIIMMRKATKIIMTMTMTMTITMTMTMTMTITMTMT